MGKSPSLYMLMFVTRVAIHLSVYTPGAPLNYFCNGGRGRGSPNKFHILYPKNPCLKIQQPQKISTILPWFFRVLDFEARFCSFLQHHSLWFLVLIVGSLQFADVVHSFFGSFIAHTLHAALHLVFNDFGHSLQFLAHFVAVLQFLLAPNVPLQMRFIFYTQKIPPLKFSYPKNLYYFGMPQNSPKADILVQVYPGNFCCWVTS